MCDFGGQPARDREGLNRGGAIVRLLSWNVQGSVPPAGSKDRIRKQVSFIEEQLDQPDIVMLNEVTNVQRELWLDLLREEQGYTEIVDTLDWGQELRESDVPPHHEFIHTSGQITAVHEDADAGDLERRRPSIRSGPWENAEMKDWSTNFPEKILSSEVQIAEESVDLWNVRTVPGSMYGVEKIKILENVYARITKSDPERCILAGDLNIPKAERPDGTVVSWGEDKPASIRERWISAELDVMTGLSDVGLVDAFRHVHGYGDLDTEDTSHESRRIDHIFASESLNPERCWYDHDGYECSDHAPMLMEFSV